MVGELIKVKAQIHFLSHSEGGRVHPVTSRYRPNHKFDDSNFYIGQVDFDDDSWHYPGETTFATISFLPSPGLAERLLPGFVWEVTEGAHVVGHATLLNVL